MITAKRLRGSEGNSRKEDRRAAIVACGDASPVFEATEHDLDAAATPVPALTLSDRLVARSSGRDAGLDALGLKSVPERVDVVAAVDEQPVRFRLIV